MTDLVDGLRAAAFPLDEDPTRLVVPEPFVKAMLRDAGVAVPDGGTIRLDLRESGGPSLSHPPFAGDPRYVLKAFGPAIVHKSELGAVRTGLEISDLGGAVAEMRTALHDHGLEPAGFLWEHQVEGTVELIVGVVDREPFGPVVVLGLGGVLTELLDAVTARLCPIDRVAAESMLDDFPGAAVLGGLRGDAPADRDALVDLLLAIAGAEGVVDRLGDALAELECNPVIAGPDGAVAADARLVLHAHDTVADPLPSPVDFDALFAPRSVAVVGASTSRSSFGNRALAAYRAMGWTDGLYTVHPTATAVDGVPAFPSVAALPGGGADYLLVAVPAAACVELVAGLGGTGGRAGVAHVVSGGFGETGPAGRRLEDDLRAAARAAGVRVVGPNCIGVYAPAGRQTFQLDVPHDAGRVGIVSQSGGLAGDMVKVGAARGLRFSKLVSMGNAVDVSPGELIEHLVDDADTGVIGLYLEGARDGARVIDALRRARGHKPVVVLVGGLSGEGSRAVASHTGALAGDERMWEAVALATGVTVVRTLEELVGALVFHQRYVGHAVTSDPNVPADAVMVLGVGGGASVLGADACDRAGLALPKVRADVVERLRGMGYGAGTSVLNPLEVPMGPAAPADTFNRVLDVVLPEQPFPDVLMHVNVGAYYGYGTEGLRQLYEALDVLGRASYPARLVLAARNIEVAPPADARALNDAAIAGGIPTYRTFDEAASAIAAGKAHDDAQPAR